MGDNYRKTAEHRQQSRQIDQQVADRARVPDHLVNHAPVSLLIESRPKPAAQNGGPISFASKVDRCSIGGLRARVQATHIIPGPANTFAFGDKAIALRRAHHLLITIGVVSRLSFDLALMCCGSRARPRGQSWLSARRHQKHEGELRRGNSAKRGKARRVAKAAKRTVARAKPKRGTAKKAARKVKQPVAPAVEIVAVEVIEQPAPGVITVTEVEETRQVS
jgi:hypothetical protein